LQAELTKTENGIPHIITTRGWGINKFDAHTTSILDRLPSPPPPQGSLRRKLKRSRGKCSTLEEQITANESNFARRVFATKFVANIVLSGLYNTLQKQHRQNIQKAIKIASRIEKARALSTRNEAIQRKFLVDFFMATGGNAWYNNKNWLSSYSLKHWHGLSCDDEGNVLKICLPSNNLEGSIPSTIGSLCYLTHLWLDGNKLHGSLPEALGQCHSLISIQIFANQLLGRRFKAYFTAKNIR
jgi:hypothetical protein